MPNFDNWIRSSNLESRTSHRAELAYRRIQEKPSVITIDRLGTTQTVRVEFGKYTFDENGGLNMQQNMRGELFGISGHATLPSNNFMSDDRFSLNGETYIIEAVRYTLGEIQAVFIKTN